MDLNKTCPKDCYSIPQLEVGALVNSIVDHDVFCFLDAFKGYHQIGMEKEDQENSFYY